ncbi:MAG: zinc ribbon domain-containing protein [Desulfobacterales bacterium]|nr:zinc ribbon domain-containing protein [Desulfobacterales bacterium]
MGFATKEAVLENIIKQKRPVCPHCGIEMSIWEVPPVNFSDGLGWGEPYLFICFNDSCSLYVKGWQEIKDNYSHNASYRCMCYPGTQNFEYLPVFGSDGGKGQILDAELIEKEQAMEEAMKKGFATLADCYVSKDWITVLKIVLDNLEPMRVRIKASEMIGDFGGLDAIEPLKNYKFSNDILSEKVNEAIIKIHAQNFTRECPFCAEIIKTRAKICKHCGREVAGE